MSNSFIKTNSFIKKGKKSRNELYLPALRYVAVDDWVDKLGNDAFIAWLKFHTWVDRRDEEREFDRVPYTLESTWKKLGMGRKKFYEKVLKPLWEHWLIDLVEYDESDRKAQKPKNIVVYESPMNKHETEIQPLKKLRDWDKDYDSPSKAFGRRGGQIAKEKAKGKSDTSNPLQTERVYPLQTERVTRSKWSPNNETNNLVINTNKPNNDSNHHHNSEHETSRNSDVSKWNDDDDYMMFRGLFLSVGADDIKRHDLHYSAFLSAKKKVGIHKLLKAAERYISQHGELSQIVPFLKGEYHQYLIDQTKKKLTNSLPQAILEAQQEAKEQAATLDKDKDWQERITEKLAMWEALKKERQKDSSFE